MKKLMVVLMVGVASMAKSATVCDANSKGIGIDLTVGTRTAVKTEVVNYSTEWVDDAGDGATAIVAVGGTTLSEQAGSGTVEWTPRRNGTYELTHKVTVGGEQIGETLTAIFEVTEFCEEVVDGIEWTFTVTNGVASVISVATNAVGSVAVPSTLGGREVKGIANEAFDGCDRITSVTIPSGVTSMGQCVFNGCSGLKSVTLEGDAPSETSAGMFVGAPSDLVVHVKDNSWGWTQWNGRRIKFDADGGSSASSNNLNLTITNIVVHYIQTSEQSPMVAPITKDVGLVNIITEIKGGKVSVPDSWAANYPGFEEKFGSDFGEALTSKSGKYDAANNPMFVWQDYVAGTDPTDEEDVFRASITMDENGMIVVSYTPELSDDEKAKRQYTTYGKKSLTDKEWVVVPTGSEADYNFFKVTVEMK